MQVSKIEKIDNVFYVTMKPTLFEYIFKFKRTKIEEYKQLTDQKYSVESFSHLGVYIDKSGAVLGPTNPLTTQLDNFKRAW